MSVKVAYIDFWQECIGSPVSYDDIHNINTWNNLNIIRQYMKIDKGVGLFHKDHLEKILNKKIILTDPIVADVIICSGFGHQKYLYPHKKKIYLSYEPIFDVPDKKLNGNTIYFSSKINKSDDFFYLPLYICYYGYGLYEQLKKERTLLSEIDFKSKKNCLSIISNMNGGYRNIFLDKLMNKISVDNYGKYKQNINDPLVQSSCWYDPRLCYVIKKYKFMLCMENTNKKFYHTEKIMHAFRNNIIPIYWGDEVCRLIFNSDAYINVNELGEEKAIEKIVKLCDDVNEYNKMLKEPIFKENSILLNKDFNKYMSEDYFKEKIRNIFI